MYLYSDGKQALCGVSVNRYSERVSKSPIGPAGDFARKIADVILALAETKKGGKDGRWLAENVGRSKDYWNRGFNYKYPFNVNDVEDVATVFGITPYEIALYAQKGVPANVSEGLGKVTNIRQRRRSDVAAANPPDGARRDYPRIVPANPESVKKKAALKDEEMDTDEDQ